MTVPIQNPHAIGGIRGLPTGINAQTSHRSTAAGTTGAASVTFAADTLRGYYISEVTWSYAATPNGGRVTILSGSDILKEFFITQSGMGQARFDPPLLTGKNEAVTLSAFSGNTAGATGTLDCTIWRI